ncbi:MAG: hypothetical protein Q8R01_02950 [Ramlibacter sp.]|nr:hypothetical protein [Ramlibacter sp.]
MREIHHDAPSPAFGHDFRAGGRQPAVTRLGRLVIAQRALDEMHHLHVADTERVSVGHPFGLALEEVRGLGGEQHARRARQRGVHIGRRERLRHVPAGQLGLVACQPRAERLPQLARFRFAMLPPASRCHADPAMIVGDGPCEQRGPGLAHVANEVQPEQPGQELPVVRMHVREPRAFVLGTRGRSDPGQRGGRGQAEPAARDMDVGHSHLFLQSNCLVK